MAVIIIRSLSRDTPTAIFDWCATEMTCAFLPPVESK